MRQPLGRNGWSWAEAKGKERKKGQLGVHLCGFRQAVETQPAQVQISVGVSKASAWEQARVSCPDHEIGDA
jgi:hypothetical protein